MEYSVKVTEKSQSHLLYGSGAEGFNSRNSLEELMKLLQSSLSLFTEMWVNHNHMKGIRSSVFQ